MEEQSLAMFVNQHGRLNPYYNGRYSWSCKVFFFNIQCKFVLILIIMEDTHGVFIYRFEHNVPVKVLILIIMEDTHGVICNICFNIH